MRRAVAVLVVVSSMAALCAAGLLPSSVAAAAEGPFPDVPADHPFVDDITWMVAEGITEGYADGTFRPGAPITRQAMAAFLHRFAGSPLGDDPGCTTSPFPDVPVTHPFCGEIEWLVAEGITTGYADGTFRPGDAITRQAMAAFLYRVVDSPDGDDPGCAAAPFPDVASAHPFCGEIEWLVAEEITTGYADGTFRPSDAITRQAMAAFLHRLSLWEPPPTEAVSWRFVPGAVLLEPGESAEVRLVGTDADGHDTSIAPPLFTLSSTSETLATLDPDAAGVVTITAGSELGVGLTTAELDSFVTAPLTITVAEVAPGVVKVPDEQIFFPPADDARAAGIDELGVGPFTWEEITARSTAGNATDPEADPVSFLSSGSRLAYVLEGAPPAVGTVLVGSGAVSLMGKVVSPAEAPNLTREWEGADHSLISVEVVPFPVAFESVQANLDSDDLEAINAPSGIDSGFCDPATDTTCDPTPVIVPGEPVVEPYTGPTAEDPDGSGGGGPSPVAPGIVGTDTDSVSRATDASAAETEFEVAGMKCKAIAGIAPANIKLDSFSPNFTSYLALQVDVAQGVQPYVRFEGGGQANPQAKFSITLQTSITGTVECEVGNGLKYVTPLKGPWGLLAPAVRLVPTLEASLALTGGPALRTEFVLGGHLRVHAGFAYDPGNRYGMNPDSDFRTIKLIEGPDFTMTPTLARLDAGVGDGSPWTLEATGGGYLKLAVGIQLGGEILDKYLNATGQQKLADELFSELGNFKAGIRARATYDSDGVVLNNKTTRSFVGVESDLKITLAPQVLNDVLALLSNNSVSFSLEIPIPSPVKLPLFQPVVMHAPEITVDDAPKPAANLQVASGQTIDLKIEQDEAKTFSFTGVLADGSIWEPGTLTHVRSDVVDLRANVGGSGQPPYLDGSILVTDELCEQWREPTMFKMLALTRFDAAIASLDTPSWAGDFTVTCIDPGIHFDPILLEASGVSTLKATSLPSSNRDWEITSPLPGWLTVSDMSGTFATADDTAPLTFTIEEPEVTCETGPVTLTAVVIASAGELNGDELDATLTVSQTFPTGPECEPTPSAGPGGAWGDPHMITLDGISYEGQVFGEYIYLEPGDGGAGTRIHARHEATDAAMLHGSRATSVTALAVETDGHTVEVYQRPTPSIYVDGVEWTPEGPEPRELSPGVSVSQVGLVTSINTPTETVTISPWASILNVSVTAAANGTLRGMLGVPDGDKSNDGTRSDGVVEPSLTTLDEIHRFTDSWWIGDVADSLLTSEPMAERFEENRYAEPVTDEDLAPTIAEIEAAIDPPVCTKDGPGAANYDALVRKLALDRYVWGAELGDLTAYACTYTVEGTATLDFDTGGEPVAMSGLELTLEAPGLDPCVTTAHVTGAYTCALRPTAGAVEPPVLPIVATVTARWPGDPTPVGTGTASFDTLAPFMEEVTATADVAVDPESLVILDVSGMILRDGVADVPSAVVTVDVDLPDTDPNHRLVRTIETAADGSYRLLLITSRSVTTADVELRFEDDGWPAIFTTSATDLAPGVNPIALDAIYDRVALHVTGDIVKDGEPVPGSFFFVVHAYTGPYTTLFDTTYITSIGHSFIADAEGHYDETVYLPPDTRNAGLRLDVDAQSFDMAHVQLTPGANDVVFDVDASQPTLALTGTVVKDGAPYTGQLSLSIYAYKANPAGGDPIYFWPAFRTVTPDVAGQWSLDEVLPRETILVKVQMYAADMTVSTEAPITMGVNPVVFDADLTRPTVELTGMATRNGLPLPGTLNMNLLPYVHTPGRTPEWFALDNIQVFPQAGADGQYAIDVDLPAAANHVVISTEIQGALHQTAVDVTPGSNPVTFDIADDRPVLDVSGTVIDETGPVTLDFPFAVEAYRHGDLPEDPPVFLGYAANGSVFPDAAGAYELNDVLLLPETELVRLVAVVQDGEYEQWVDVFTGDNTTVFDVDASSQLLNVSGTVIKNGEGTNLPVTLTIEALNRPAPGEIPTLLQEIPVEVTPVDGVYEVVGQELPEGTNLVWLSMSIGGQGNFVEIEPVGPGTTTGTLDLDVTTSGIHLDGFMRYEDGSPITNPVWVVVWPDDIPPANPEEHPDHQAFYVDPDVDGAYVIDADMPPETTRIGVQIRPVESIGVSTAFDASGGTTSSYGIDWTFERPQLVTDGTVTFDGAPFTGPIIMEVHTDMMGDSEYHGVSWDEGLGSYVLDTRLPLGSSNATVRVFFQTGGMECSTEYNLPSLNPWDPNLLEFAFDALTTDEATCFLLG